MYSSTVIRLFLLFHVFAPSAKIKKKPKGLKNKYRARRWRLATPITDSVLFNNLSASLKHKATPLWTALCAKSVTIPYLPSDKSNTLSMYREPGRNLYVWH